MRTLRLLQEIARREEPIEATVFLVSGQTGVLDEAYKATGTRLVYSKPGIGCLADLYRLCRSARADVVHVSAALASGFYCMAAWFAGVPVRVAHMRNTGYDRRGALFALRNVFYRMFLNRFSTRVIGVAAGTRMLSRSSDRKWRTLYNGVDIPDLDTPLEGDPRWPDDALNILLLGRLHAQKNPLRALAVVEAVRRRLPADRKVLLHVVGRSMEPLRSQMEAEIDRRGLSDLVVFHGETDRPVEALRQASVLLLTSTHEGLPGVVIEALACGTPVVGSRIPGVCEIAAATSGVRVVDLDQNDEDWADAVLASESLDRRKIQAAFRQSPFVFDTHYREMMKLWRDG